MTETDPEARLNLPKDLKEIARHRMASASAAASQLAQQLGGWLVLGNVAGLLLVLNAMLDHKICDFTVFRPIAAAFGAGALLGFISVALAASGFDRDGRAFQHDLAGSREGSYLSLLASGDSAFSVILAAASLICLGAPAAIVVYDARYQAALCALAGADPLTSMNSAPLAPANLPNPPAAASP